MRTDENSADRSASPGLPFRSAVARALIGGMLIFVAIGVSSVAFFGSLNLAIAALRGDEVIIEAVLPPDDNSSTSQPLSIVAASLSSDELTILGAESGCGCIEFDGLPAKIPPRGRCVIHARGVPGQKRTNASRVVIYTTSRVNPRIAAIVPP